MFRTLLALLPFDRMSSPLLVRRLAPAKTVSVPLVLPPFAISSRVHVYVCPLDIVATGLFLLIVTASLEPGTVCVSQFVGSPTSELVPPTHVAAVTVPAAQIAAATNATFPNTAAPKRAAMSFAFIFIPS